MYYIGQVTQRDDRLSVFEDLIGTWQTLMKSGFSKFM